jgi:hypothetical protein
MRRIILVLAVAALMAAMMVTGPGPASAKINGGNGGNSVSSSGGTGGNTSNGISVVQVNSSVDDIDGGGIHLRHH